MRAAWRKQLDDFFGEAGRVKQGAAHIAPFTEFISKTVVPAFEDVREAMAHHGRESTIRSSDVSAAILIYNGSDEEMSYRIQGRMFPSGFRPYAEVRFRERKGLRYVTIESLFRAGDATCRVGDITKDEIIQDFLEHYMRRVKRE
ncbi:MAG: hypothetical protein FJ224_07025 [Lentisphaerae bacterium]|nr:hypothetical protein [Lentisphaerota bacterium]